MRLSRLGTLLAAAILALTALGMWFSLQGDKSLAGVSIAVALLSAVALNAATRDRHNRLTRDD